MKITLMGDKFNTVNSKLFTNNNPSRLPKWMEDFRDNAEDIINNKKSIEIEFDKKAEDLFEKICLRVRDQN